MKLSEFLDRYQDNDNEWFALDHGEAQNMFDAAVESVAVLGARAERAEAERDAARQELGRLQEVRAVGCQCGDSDACQFVAERDAARAEVARLHDELATVLTPPGSLQPPGMRYTIGQ